MRNTNNTRIDVLTVKRVCHAIPIESNLFADFYRYKQAIGIHFTSVYKWVKTNHFLKRISRFVNTLKLIHDSTLVHYLCTNDRARCTFTVCIDLRFNFFKAMFCPSTFLGINYKACSQPPHFQVPSKSFPPIFRSTFTPLYSIANLIYKIYMLIN
jgi:hypothetical protein